MAWYGMVWHGMAWYGMVWHGMALYGMVWYGMSWQPSMYYLLEGKLSRPEVLIEICHVSSIHDVFEAFLLRSQPVRKLLPQPPEGIRKATKQNN